MGSAARSLDLVPMMAYSLGATLSRVAQDGGGAHNGLTPGRRRPPSSVREHERRKKWGAEWGPRIAEAARKLREGRE